MEKVIPTVNYEVTGIGGEFIATILLEAISGSSNSSISSKNQYTFRSISGIDHDVANFCIKTIIKNATDPLDLIKIESVPGEDRFYSGFKEKVVSFYDIVKGNNHLQTLENIKSYLEKNVGPKDVFIFHFPTAEAYKKLCIDTKYFISNSKPIYLDTSKISYHTMNLLYLHKVSQNVSRFKTKQDFKDSLLRRIFVYYDREYYRSPGSIVIDCSEFLYNRQNIDKQLSEYLNTEVNLDYDKILSYSKKNVDILREQFNVDIFKDYDKQFYIDRMNEYCEKL